MINCHFIALKCCSIQCILLKRTRKMSERYLKVGHWWASQPKRTQYIKTDTILVDPNTPSVVLSLTGHIKHAKEPYHIYLNLRTVRIMCWIDKIDNIDRISAREKVSIVVFITRQNGGKARFGRSLCNSWRNILANSANYKAFRGKVIMSTSDMIIIESCGCIGNTTWSVWIEKYHRKPHVYTFIETKWRSLNYDLK